MSEIVFTFKKGGKTTMEVKGIGGADCKAVSAPYKGALAGQVTSDDPTCEMQNPSNVPAQNKQQLRT